MSDAPQLPSTDTPSGSHLRAGDQVGRFRIEGFLGAGGMGEVYRAWDPTLERSVALKALRGGSEGEQAAPERFRREALALAQLNHPSVCQVHDWVEGPGGTFIAMELVEGQTLDQAAARMKAREKLQVILAIARGLEAAHAKGLVHRDLKPGNVMVSPGAPGEGPRVKVLDFGLARLMDPRSSPETYSTPSAVPNLALLRALEASDRSRGEGTEPTALPRSHPPEGSVHSWERLTQAGCFMGSPSHASPEQIQGQTAGPASDIFSLGIVAWELLTGEHPFPGEGRVRMRAIVEGAQRELRGRGLPSGTAPLIKAMLEPHPFKRPTARRVAQSLERILRPTHWLRWGLAAAAGAVAVGISLSWSLGRGILADLTRSRPARLLLLPFDNRSGNPALDAVAHQVLPELLEHALRDQTHLAPLELEGAIRARNALRLSQGPLAPIDQTRLAEALGAQLLLRGQLQRTAEGGCLLAFELVEPSGRSRLRGSTQSTGQPSLVALPLARGVAETVLKAVDPLGTRGASSLAEVPPNAMEAYLKGTELMDKGAFKEASPQFQDACRVAPGFAPAVLGYARCLSRLAEAPPEPAFQWARWAARAQGLRHIEMKALHLLAVRYGDRGEWEASETAAREALELAGALHDTTFEAGVHATLGVNLQRRNRIPEAEAELRTSLAMYQSLGDRLNATRAMNNLAVIERGRGNLKGAEARYQEGLETVRTYGDRWMESILLNNLGDLALAQEGGLDRAEAFYTKSRALREAIGDQNGLVYTLVGLGSVAQARGDLDRAEGFQRQVLELARKGGLRPMEALARFNLGELARAGGRFGPAILSYRESLSLHQELKDAAMEGHCLAAEAECMARQGRPGMGRALYTRSRALATEDTPYLLRAQAWIEQREGHGDQARETFARALSAARIEAPEIVRELKEAR